MWQKIKIEFRRIFCEIVKYLTFAKQNIVSEEIIDLDSEHLKRLVKLRVFNIQGKSKLALPLLLINDGQDLERMDFKATLQTLYDQNKIKPILAIGIDAGDRIQEYGTANQLDYKMRGNKSKAYERFILKELIPFLSKKYDINHSDISIAGFSLGGLSAFDLLWNNNSVFKSVGVFSGSFWWRSEEFDEKNPDADRIVHEQVKNAKAQRTNRFWFQTGTHDEASDRNNNGIIDAIDDTLDLIEALKSNGVSEKSQIRYLEIEKGEHNPDTWKIAMPDFLMWNY